MKHFFQVAERGSTVSTEVLAGISTFLSLSYIFVVNPAILANAGMDKSFVLFATIIASEMNAYVAFFVVGALKFSWQDALGAVFWSGVLCIVVTASRARERIIEAIPDRMKSGLSLCVGVFLALVALKVSGVLRYEGVKLVGFGHFFTHEAIGLYIGTGLILLFERFKLRAAVLLGIVLATAYCHWAGIGFDAEKPAQLSAAMFSGIGQLNIGVILNPKVLSVVLILFLLDFYGSVAKFIGLTASTNLVKNGRLPQMREALYVDGIATVGGAGLGTTSLITYVESAVGIGVGGRTGITAIVCGILMLACFLIAPLLKFVPVVATTGALVYVAIKLCPSGATLKTFTRADMIILGFMQIAVIAFFAIDKAMLIGCVAYIAADMMQRSRPNPYLLGSAVLLAIGTLMQYMQ